MYMCMYRKRETYNCGVTDLTNIIIIVSNRLFIELLFMFICNCRVVFCCFYCRPCQMQRKRFSISVP